jgi:hypothetical protein
VNPALSAMLTEQLTERAATDPLAALMLTQLNQPEAPEEPAQVDQSLNRAIRTISRLQDEVTAANAMAVQVARVIGACSGCWGLDPLCRQCFGVGTPGSQPPDREALLNWLGPALSRAGIISTSDPNRTTPVHT